MSTVRRIRLNLEPTLDQTGVKEAIFKVASSRLGTREDALRLIEYAAHELLSERRLDEDVQEWLGLALMAISAGVDPKTALCLQKRGTPPKLSWEDVLPLVHHRIMAGEAWTTVCQDAAVELGEIRGGNIDEKTVRLIYTSSLQGWYDSWIEDPPFDGPPTDAQAQAFMEYTIGAISANEAVRRSVERASRTVERRRK